MRILIIEDNLTIATNLCDYLEIHGFSIQVAYDGVQGFQLATDQAFDVILLDLGLPHMDGIELCNKLRKEVDINLPILILTARDTLDDKLQGFQSGADDYLVKPFALEEVEARINALFKRHTVQTNSPIIKLGHLRFNRRNMMVTYAGNNVILPPKCIRIIEIFMKDPDRLFSRQELEIELWGKVQETSERLRHHISILRRSLIHVSGQNMIKTVHGMGYSISSEE